MKLKLNEIIIRKTKDKEWAVTIYRNIAIKKFQSLTKAIRFSREYFRKIYIKDFKIKINTNVIPAQ
ncbi:MAG: hypothetical protein MRY83_24845 [Flavobacteriales bacterium]|nr:hypothetical protein [Flavobacteriales bacterium]